MPELHSSITLGPDLILKWQVGHLMTALNPVSRTCRHAGSHFQTKKQMSLMLSPKGSPSERRIPPTSIGTDPTPGRTVLPTRPLNVRFIYSYARNSNGSKQ